MYSSSKRDDRRQFVLCRIVRTSPKDFGSFSSVLFQQFIIQICACLYTQKLKMQIFDPIACGNTADTINLCQMMSYFHI